jgi:hypothetical protein
LQAIFLAIAAENRLQAGSYNRRQPIGRLGRPAFAGTLISPDKQSFGAGFAPALRDAGNAALNIR